MIHVQQMKGGWSDGTHRSQLPRPMAQVAAVTCVPTAARGPNHSWGQRRWLLASFGLNGSQVPRGSSPQGKNESTRGLSEGQTRKLLCADTRVLSLVLRL